MERIFAYEESEEDRAAHSPGSAIDDEVALKEPEHIENESRIDESLHMIQHLLICQDKRMTRLKAVKYFFIWHQKAILYGTRQHSVRIDPYELIYAIRKDYCSTWRTTSSMSSERESSFKPVLMSTGLEQKCLEGGGREAKEGNREAYT